MASGIDGDFHNWGDIIIKLLHNNITDDLRYAQEKYLGLFDLVYDDYSPIYEYIGGSMYGDSGFHPHIQEFFPEMVLLDRDYCVTDYKAFVNYQNGEECGSTMMLSYNPNWNLFNFNFIIPFTYHLRGDGEEEHRGIIRENYEECMNDNLYARINDMFINLDIRNPFKQYIDFDRILTNNKCAESNFLAIPIKIEFLGEYLDISDFDNCDHYQCAEKIYSLIKAGNYYTEFLARMSAVYVWEVFT